MSIFQDILGSITNFFQVGGPTGPGWNNSSGTLQARNAANSAFANAQGATPVGSNDLTTKGYVDGITLGNFFHVGGSSGPGWNNSSGTLQARNSANNAYAVAQGATPVGDNDLTTKQYADNLSKPIPASQQFNGNSSLPSNSGTEQWYVVTTTGTNASIGQLLWDDGTSSGTAQVVTVPTNGIIFTPSSLSGGTITLSANQLYYWTGSAWTSLIPSVAGATYAIDVPIGTSASYTSTAIIPANAVIFSATLNIETPYSGGTTISLGQTGSASLLLGTGGNVATTAALYGGTRRISWGGSPLALLVTISGSPGVGAGHATVIYAVPNS